MAGNLTDAAARALHAGVDDDMPDGEAFANLPQALAAGKVTPAEIDTAVRRVLRLKFLGASSSIRTPTRATRRKSRMTPRLGRLP